MSTTTKENAALRATVARLREGIVKLHYGCLPEMEEVRVPPHGDVEYKCSSCAERWPCGAAALLDPDV